MWLSPKTLFYPFFGFDFPQGVIEQHWWEYFLMCFFGIVYRRERGDEVDDFSDSLWAQR